MKFTPQKKILENAIFEEIRNTESQLLTRFDDVNEKLLDIVADIAESESNVIDSISTLSADIGIQFSNLSEDVSDIIPAVTDASASIQTNVNANTDSAISTLSEFITTEFHTVNDQIDDLSGDVQEQCGGAFAGVDALYDYITELWNYQKKKR